MLAQAAPCVWSWALGSGSPWAAAVPLKSMRRARLGGRLTVTNAGGVGIGTATPGAPLHVADHMVVGPFAATGGQGGIDVTGPLAELGFVRRTLSSWPNPTQAGDRYVWYNPDGTARLWTEQNGDLLTVNNSGRVGIGTTNPQTKLQVEGDFRATGTVQFPKTSNGFAFAHQPSL